MIITITGKPSSGKSSYAKYIANKYKFKLITIGDILREEAEARGLTVLEMSKVAVKDPSIDIKMESANAKLGKELEGQKVIFDGRLSWRFVPKSFKVFVDLPDDEMAERVMASERPTSEKGKSKKQAKEMLKKRWQVENDRYMALYGVNNLDLSQYDFVINSMNKTVEEVSEEIYAEYKAFVRKSKEKKSV